MVITECYNYWNNIDIKQKRFYCHCYRYLEEYSTVTPTIINKTS